MRNLLANRQGGFTLLEVVFAVGILAIGMLGYTSLKVSNRYSWFFAKNLSQAVQLTSANLEGLLMAGYNDAGWMSAGGHSVVFNADGTINAVDTATNKGLNDKGSPPAVTSGDFAASDVTWTVREGCPSELTKLVSYTNKWSNDSNELKINQVQVRP